MLGPYSPISDSQSLSSDPQSREEIIEKQRNAVETILRKEISREIIFYRFLGKNREKFQIAFFIFSREHDKVNRAK